MKFSAQEIVVIILLSFISLISGIIVSMGMMSGSYILAFMFAPMTALGVTLLVVLFLIKYEYNRSIRRNSCSVSNDAVRNAMRIMARSPAEPHRETYQYRDD